jgi:hypothetical protein
VSTPAFLHALRPFDGRDERSIEKRKARSQALELKRLLTARFSPLRPRCNYATQHDSIAHSTPDTSARTTGGPPKINPY